jgi:Type II secretion system (T2SS), protein N
MSKWVYVTVVGFACAVGAVVMVPIHAVEARINRALGGEVRFAAGTGTVWNGNGTLMLPSQAGALSVPVSWQFDLAALTRLQIGHTLRLNARGLTGLARVGMGFGGISVRDADISTTLDTLVRLSRPNTALQLARPEARLRLTTPAGPMQFSGRNTKGTVLINGQVNVQVDDFTLRNVSARPLGSFALPITFKDAVAESKITDAKGLIRIDGVGKLNLSVPRPLRTFSFAGFLLASATLPPSLQVALGALGRASADGRIRVDFGTSF